MKINEITINTSDLSDDKQEDAEQNAFKTLLKEYEKKWFVLDGGNGWQFIVPDCDIKPHTKTTIIFPDGNMEGELAGYDCPCKPAINFTDKLIIHNAFDGRN